MSELIEKRPLAYGFIEDGNLHSLIKWPFMEEVSVFQPVGKSLVDFIRFDSDFMRSVFHILLAGMYRRGSIRMTTISSQLSFGKWPCSTD